MSLKIIRLTYKNRKKYQRSLHALKGHGPVVTESKPYIGMLNKQTKKIIACIWIDDMNEISIITHANYRRQKIMTKLLLFIQQDVYLNKLTEIVASPVNDISKKLIKKMGFVKSIIDGYYEYSID